MFDLAKKPDAEAVAEQAPTVPDSTEQKKTLRDAYQNAATALTLLSDDDLPTTDPKE